MAGSGGRSRELRAEAAGPKRRSQKWEVEFARYFATPRRSPSTPPPPGLRFVTRGRHRLHGTWLPAASLAALCISRARGSFAAHVLTVSVGDVVYLRLERMKHSTKPEMWRGRKCNSGSSEVEKLREEHYVSILNFSWPQVACVTECPVRGSRVVFVSFCDRFKQIQKFAVRFPHLSDAETFLNSVKELPSNTMDAIPSGSGSDCVYEDSPSSEYIASDRLQYRSDEVASFEKPTSDHRTDVPSLGYPEELDQSVLRSPLATNIDRSYSGFPHSYSEMPTGYSIKNEKDVNVPCPVIATDHAPEKAYTLDSYSEMRHSYSEMPRGYSIKNEKDGYVPCPTTAIGHAPEKAYTLDTYHDASVAVAGKELIADKGKGPAKEIDASMETLDILAGIQTYVAGDSFNDMLASLDRAIDELGGDMLL